ncbi:hypothetical protein J4462_01295 [Candidatus Pacearchaeota archaeon]|nr:hypothetical protein [Candidatus Pacearchaeota archaeon]
MKKGGMSHVEMIISFILFVTAIGFALYFLSPFDSNRLVESSLTWTFREISENASILVHTFPVKVDNSENRISDILAVRIDNVNMDGMKSRVENSSGGVLVSGVNNKIVFVRNPGWDEKDFILIKLSQDFEDGDHGLSGIVDESYYEIAYSDTKELISERRIVGLRENYLADYLMLKKNFNLPNRVNFAFSLKFKENDEIIVQRDISSGLEVFSESRRKEILRSDGKVEFAELTVLVW